MKKTVADRGIMDSGKKVFKRFAFAKFQFARDAVAIARMHECDTKKLFKDRWIKVRVIRGWPECTREWIHCRDYRPLVG